MRRHVKIYNFFQLCSAVFLILALLWLTISLPFVYASQQELAKQNKSQNAAISFAGNEEETTNPFSNTEEKAPANGASFSEEYMHDNHKADYFFSIASQYHKCENADTYHAFHGELLVPPPNPA
ncbi:MAG: hypothetical protein ACXWWC_07865 [Chitinophagaceae bacterium]